VAAWYVIGLGLVGFFMFIAIFIGLTVFGTVYGCIIGLITLDPRVYQADTTTGRPGSGSAVTSSPVAARRWT